MLHPLRLSCDKPAGLFAFAISSGSPTPSPLGMASLLPYLRTSGEKTHPVKVCLALFPPTLARTTVRGFPQRSNPKPGLAPASCGTPRLETFFGSNELGVKEN